MAVGASLIVDDSFKEYLVIYKVLFINSKQRVSFLVVCSRYIVKFQ